MEESFSQLQQFFALKCQSGEPISPDETEWIQTLLEGVDSSTFDESQSIVAHGEPINCFLQASQPQTQSLSQSSYTFSQPSTYDASEVLKKYQNFYRQPVPHQPRPLLQPTVKAPKLPGASILNPILRTFQSQPAAKEPVKVEQPIPPVEKPATEGTAFLTSTANAIMQILGDNKRGKLVDHTSAADKNVGITEAKMAENPETRPPNLNLPPLIPITMTPSPSAVVRPFIVDAPNDSEAHPKRLRLDKTADETDGELLRDNEIHSEEPSLPLFEFRSQSSDSLVGSLPSESSIKRQAIEAQESQLPTFSF